MSKQLDFSFCIVTDNSMEACKRISSMVYTIRALKIPNYEILVIGGSGSKFGGDLQDFTKIDFDESVKRGWITKKKNDIAKIAKYDNLVICHDYFLFHRNWYDGYLKIYEDFVKSNICCNPVYMIDGRREYTDWVTWDHPDHGRQASLNYNDWEQTKHQYISGGYFVTKKEFFMNNPLNENLSSHDGEDVEWSLRIRNQAKIICNPNSYVKHNKKHRNLSVDFWERLV